MTSGGGVLSAFTDVRVISARVMCGESCVMPQLYRGCLQRGAVRQKKETRLGGGTESRLSPANGSRQGTADKGTFAQVLRHALDRTR
jgi:hypothetical protein